MESEKCAVCDNPASQTCAHCGIISYCGKEHQKDHWPVHKNVCKPYRIERNDEMGRFMVASRDIKQGELIVKESPILIGPRMDSVPICLGCYKNVSRLSITVCSRCLQAPICSQECEKESDHTQLECDALIQLTKQNSDWSLSSNLHIVMPLRCFLLKPQLNSCELEEERWSNILGLESHTKERKDTEIWKYHQNNVIDVLQSANIISSDEDCSLMHRICGILDVNSFELRGPNPALMTHTGRQGERLRGIYLQAALMSHDCIGNTHLSVDDNYVMTIHASVPIKAGEPIFFNYTSTLECTLERREHLKEGKYFHCTCKRCLDPTELGTYMSSIICSRCHDGYVIQYDPQNNKQHKNDFWSCEKCHHRFHPRLIKGTMSRAWTEIEETDSTDFKALETLLKRFSRTFSPSNSVVVEIKQNLVAVYREIILREPNPQRQVIQRKIDLCLELLNILKTVEPGISRLRGITLYELHIPMVLLANKEYDAGEVDAKELLSRLTDAEGFLREAVSMLLYEPANSPEGHLLRIAMDELRVLRDNIQDVKMLNECSQQDERTSKRKSVGKKSRK